MLPIKKLFSGINSRLLFASLRGARTWGTLFGTIFWASVVFGPPGFVPVQHPRAVAWAIPVLMALVLLLAYMFRESKSVVSEKLLALIWLCVVFFVYFELQGINSAYLITIIFPLLVESGKMDARWLAQISGLSMLLFLLEAGYEFWQEGSMIIFPFLYNGFLYSLFIIYFNVIVRNIFGYVTETAGEASEHMVDRMVVLREERGGFVERLLLPIQRKIVDMMKTIDEARTAESPHLQGALLGVLYEQLYDAHEVAHSEERELLSGLEISEYFSLLKIVDEVLASVEALRTSEGVKVTRGEGLGVEVRAPRGVCVRGLRALIENAILYSPEGQVDISATSEKGTVRMIIVDNGIGIPDDFLDLRFIRGARASNAKNLRPGRRGDGLADAQVSFSSFGGEVDIEPRADSRGTIATIILPAGLV